MIFKKSLLVGLLSFSSINIHIHGADMDGEIPELRKELHSHTMYSKKEKSKCGLLIVGLVLIRGALYYFNIK